MTTTPQAKLIPHPRGQNVAFACTWRQLDTTVIPNVWRAVDLTGLTLEVFEISGLEGAVLPVGFDLGWSVTITDAAAGKFSVARAWDATWPNGTGRLVRFRLRSTTGTRAFGPFDLDIK